MTHDDLHIVARAAAECLKDPDKKQLRFNEIVECAKEFYPANVAAGVRELVQSCERGDPLYIKGEPMWATLRTQYQWMRAGG